MSLHDGNYRKLKKFVRLKKEAAFYFKIIIKNVPELAEDCVLIESTTRSGVGLRTTFIEFELILRLLFLFTSITCECNSLIAYNGVVK